jgi:hypothetical protein
MRDPVDEFCECGEPVLECCAPCCPAENGCDMDAVCGDAESGCCDADDFLTNVDPADSTVFLDT